MIDAMFLNVIDVSRPIIPIYAQVMEKKITISQEIETNPKILARIVPIIRIIPIT